MAAKFWDFSIQSDLRKQRSDFSAQAALRGAFLPRGIPQNISYFLFHAAMMPLGTPPQP
jgi:hypothetical protein